MVRVLCCVIIKVIGAKASIRAVSLESTVLENDELFVTVNFLGIQKLYHKNFVVAVPLYLHLTSESSFSVACPLFL